MSLPLTCPCGARFEVAETLAGQSIACPECQQALKVPAAARARLRTSGYALASVVLALVGMFTIVFTAIAVLLGFIALVSVSRNRARVTGVGYAVFGIIVGLTFTGLTMFAVSREEIFDKFREQVHAGEADYSGPMEIIRAAEGFAITRPTARWGVARESFEDEDGGNKGLILANVGKDAYVQVLSETVEPHKSLEKCMDDFVASLRTSPKSFVINRKQIPARTTAVKVHESRRLPAVNGMEIVEVRIDLRLAGHPLSYLARVCKRDGSSHSYVIDAWVLNRRFAQVEPEMRKALDSFRILKND
jgi:hypothetical protein